MKNIRRALVTSVVTLAACGLASAGTITQSFTLGTQATNWTLSNSTGVQSYDYLQSLNPSAYGSLNSVVISATWASTGYGSATDNNSGSTGNDSYTFTDSNIVTLKADGNALSFADNSAGDSLLGCTDAGFTHISFSQVMTEPGCVDSSTLEGSNSKFNNTYTTGGVYSWFVGTATQNSLTFTGTASTSASFSGPPYNGGSGSGVANEVVTVVYNYSAPFTGAPEPTTMFLMGSALVGCGLLRKRMKKS